MERATEGNVNDFTTEHLDGTARIVADLVVATLTADLGKAPYAGGCRAFYSPQEWVARGERYGRDAVLILVHDGGDLSYYCNPDKGDHAAVRILSDALRAHGFFIQACTCWYSAIYIETNGAQQ
jgi:hypothetical protein